MKIKHNNISNESHETQYLSEPCASTEEILKNVEFLQESYGSISSLHALYFSTIKDIQANLIERLKNNRFEDPSFVTDMTAKFVLEIIDDLQDESKNKISKLIAEFYLKYPDCEGQITSSKLGMMMSYRFIVGQMSHMEDRLRANAMTKAGKPRFTKNDKKEIIHVLTSVVYDHTRVPVFPKKGILSPLAKISEKLIKLGIKRISVAHIDKSISISKSLISQERQRACC